MSIFRAVLAIISCSAWAGWLYLVARYIWMDISRERLIVKYGVYDALKFHGGDHIRNLMGLNQSIGLPVLLVAIICTIGYVIISEQGGE